jgi:hypothetical protein
MCVDRDTAVQVCVVECHAIALILFAALEVGWNAQCVVAVALFDLLHSNDIIVADFAVVIRPFDLLS